MEHITITYTLGIKVDAGWRSVEVKALAEKQGGYAVVKNVLEIDGETPAYGQSRTGAKRQQFNGRYWADRQVGAKKRVSACVVV